jgi:DNA mismatch repair protein MutL
MGWEIVLEGGKIVSEAPVAREPGTTIEVRDIFFNTPARFKFLKSDVTERTQCLRIIEEMVFEALSVTFHVQIEKSKPLSFNAFDMESPQDVAKSLRSRITETWGAKWGQGLALVSSQTPHFSLTGVVTNQGYHQSSPKFQLLFVNRRPVQNRRLTRALYDAYRGQLPSLRHPGWVLFLEVNPQSVDVNVHPAKREVKLTHENEIFGFLLKAVQNVLSQTEDVPVKLYAPAASEDQANVYVSSARFESKGSVQEPRPVLSPGVLSTLKEVYRPLSLEGRPPPTAGTLVDWMKSPLPEQKPLPGLRVEPMRAIAQVGKMFIVAERIDGLVIVDQHAAAEKIIYEGLFANFKATTPQMQMQLVPLTWEVAHSVASALRPHLEVFQTFGFLIEPFGAQTFLVKGIPSVLGEKFDLHSLLDSLSDVVLEPDDQRGGHERNFEHRLAAMTACKSAIRAGDSLDLIECQHVLDELFKLEAPLTCPHGRPTIIQLPFTDLERKFRRI